MATEIDRERITDVFKKGGLEVSGFVRHSSDGIEDFGIKYKGRVVGSGTVSGFSVTATFDGGKLTEPVRISGFLVVKNAEDTHLEGSLADDKLRIKPLRHAQQRFG